MAGDQATKYMTDGKAQANSIVQGNYEHKNVDVDMELKGPVVVMPQNIFRFESVIAHTDNVPVELSSRSGKD